MSLYIRATEGVRDLGVLIPKEEFDRDLQSDKDCYASIYYYNKDQYNTFQQKHTIAGIKDVITDKLVFDFDSITDLLKAKEETLICVNRLESSGINNYEIYFSGHKGFTVIVYFNEMLNPKETIYLAEEVFGKDLQTLDLKIYNPSRILRLPNTKHQESNLYKIYLTKEELKDLSMETIKIMARKPRKLPALKTNKLDRSILRVKEEVQKISGPVKGLDFNSLDLKKKPRDWDNARWYLFNGFFQEGERSTALLCLGSTLKNMGYPEAIAYRTLKGVAEIQAIRTNTERFNDTELYNNIILQVYGPHWNNGQFSTKDPTSWLHQYCKKYNIKTESSVDVVPTVIGDIGDSFIHHITNFENNRIYFGLPDLDEKFPLCAGSNVGIIGAASSGKTALALNLLSNASKQGAIAVFASLDMAKNRLYEKILYKVTGGKSRSEIYDIFKNGDSNALRSLVTEQFKNVYIFDRSAPTTQSIRDYILDVQEKTGQKVKLLVIDYFERISSDISDDTASSKRVAGELQDIVNDMPELAVVTLVQPNKFSLGGGPESPLLSYTAIKGSSFLYQSFRQILSIWRPFFNPKTSDNDRYMEMAILKNDLGELDTFQYGWDGRTGAIYLLDEIQQKILNDLLRDKEDKKAEKAGWD